MKKKCNFLCGRIISASVILGFVLANVAGAQKSTTASDDKKSTAKPVLMSAAKHRELRNCFPKVGNAEIQRVLDDKRLILYTDQEMPRAYQDWDGALQGLHAVSYNISADNAEPFGNGNREFPWGHAAGTHETNNVSAVRFISLPQDEDGNPLPIVWYRKVHEGDNSSGYSWTFPIGTVVGEVLRQRAPDGMYYTFELRVRIREKGQWAVDVFRPFPTTKDLARRITQLRPQWRDDPALSKLVKHLQSQQELKQQQLADNHPRRTFQQTMGFDSLPKVGDDELVVELLTQTRFRSAVGQVWRYGKNDVWTHAPTTEAKFHIVPANYKAGFIAVDRTSCIRCHETVGRHVREFEFSRDWYGRVRGSDGIFSFHPFDLNSISYNGMGRAIQMRTDLVEAGIVEAFDSAKHPNRIYSIIPHLENPPERYSTASQTTSASSNQVETTSGSTSRRGLFRRRR